MREPVRCGVSFDNVEEFRAAFLARGKGLGFVAYPDEVEPGRPLIIDIDLAQRVRLELDGLAHQPDFDDRGNTGVLVALSAASTAILDKLEVDLRQSPLPEVIATSRAGPPAKATSTTTVPTMGAEGAPANDPLLEPGTMVDDRFRIEAHLATGGMGEVYRANHVHLKRPIALKLLRRVFASDSDMWARFQREAELVSQLESPHIVRVFDFGRTRDGQPYLAMEYVEGSTLDVLLEAGPLAPARAADLLGQVCAGLTEAHAVGVIHRDLKPANLIVGRRRDGSDVLKILDFGIARLGDHAGRSEKQKLTQLGIVVGTPAYLAPEQALADDLDHRTDIYALGCVAYELLTGGPPFRSPDLSKVLSLHLTAAPAPLESLRPELAGWPQLCAAVLKALSKERERRFSSVAEFAQALTAATLAAPVDATVADGLWPPEPAVAAPRPSASVSALPVSPAPEVDDFFEASTPAANRPRARAVAPVTAATGLAARLAAARDALTPAATRAAFLFVEVLGVQAESSAARAALERALEVAAVFGAFGEASDEDGVVLGFAATTQPPVLRAAYAALAMRDAVAFDAAASPGSTARLRCGLVVDELTRPRPATSTALARSRALCARAQAGQVACDRLLAPELSAGLELSNAGEVLLANARRAPRRGPTQLVGRASTLDLLERRLVGLQQGVVAPLVVRGPEGSGRTAVALELALRARQRSLVVVHVTATPSWAREPGSLVAALVCAALGVPMSERARLLPLALEALKLPAPVIEAVLVVSGVMQPTWAFTAGQAAQALRSVLRAGALERPVVLVIDGLEHVDQQGLEAFGELVTRPAARELTLAFTSPTLAQERLAGATVSELPALSRSDVGQLVTQALGVAGGPRLMEFLLERAGGQPAATLEWLAWLEERGALKLGATAELVDDVPALVPPTPLKQSGVGQTSQNHLTELRADTALPAARLALLPPEVARALEAATCQGETFDAAGVTTAYPGATQAVVALGRDALHARRWPPLGLSASPRRSGRRPGPFGRAAGHAPAARGGAGRAGAHQPRWSRPARGGPALSGGW
jgi:hypothetical protein